MEVQGNNIILTNREARGLGFSINLKKLKKQLSNITKDAENDLKKVEKAAAVVGAEIGKAAKVVEHDVAHVGLFIPRDSFIALIFLNFAGIAGKMNAHLNDSNTQGLQNIWSVLGGNWGKLVAAIHQGAKKKPLLGIGAVTIGIAPAVAADIASASAVLAVMSKFLAQIKPQTKALKDVTLGLDAVAAGGSATGGNYTAAEQDLISAAQTAGASFNAAQQSGTLPSTLIYKPGNGTNTGGFSLANASNTEKGLLVAGALGLAYFLTR